MNNMKLISAPGKIDYFLVLLFVNLSGNQALITGARKEAILLFSLVLVFLRMVQKRRLLLPWFLAVAAAFTILLLLQALALNFFSLSTILGFLVKLTIAAGVVSTVPYFRIVYIRVMVWLAFLSFIFHLPTILAGWLGVRLYEFFRPLAALVGAESSGVNERINIGLHNFMGGEHIYRNAGVFWEPGAFSGYLILALLLLATFKQDLPAKLIKRWRMILAVAVLSTLSTTGYLMLPLALFAFQLVDETYHPNLGKQLLQFIGVAVVFVPLAFYIWNLDFFGPKIIALYERAVFQEAGWQLSRFGTVLFDWEYIRQRPFLGWGQNNETQFYLHPDLEGFALGNGLTGFLRQMGLIGFGIFLLAYWLALGRIGITNLTRLWIVAVTVLQLNGEMFLLYPVYLSLMFIGFDKSFPTINRQVK